MREFAAIVAGDGGWYIAYCPDIPGADGQGRTIEECKRSLVSAITSIMTEAMHHAPPNI